MQSEKRVSNNALTTWLISKIRVNEGKKLSDKLEKACEVKRPSASTM